MVSFTLLKNVFEVDFTTSFSMSIFLNVRGWIRDSYNTVWSGLTLSGVGYASVNEHNPLQTVL